MRIRRFDLTRYGHFSDFSLDFNPSDRASKADFHLIYGGNEAGKSTTLHALTDFLFGFPPRTDYAFLHSNTSLELGALLEQHDQKLALTRYKKTRNSLCDQQGNVVDEHLIDTHGLDRTAYLQRFSFDDASLEAGGEDILQHRGELGAALYSATSGLGDVESRLDEAMTASDAFYMPRKRKNGKDLLRLLELKAALTELDEQLKNADINVAEWKQQTRLSEQLHANWKEQQQLWTERETVLAERRQDREALAAHLRWQTAVDRLADLEDVPSIAPERLARARELTAIRAQAQARMDDRLARREQLTAERSSIPQDKAVLDHANVIDSLADRLSLHQQNKRAAQASESEARAAHALLRQLGNSLALTQSELPDLEAPAHEWRPLPTLPTGLLDRLDNLAREHAVLSTALSTANDELQRLSAQADVITSASTSDDTQHRASTAPSDDHVNHGQPLTRLLHQLQESQPVQALRREQDRCNQLLDAFERCCNDLKPWRGNADAVIDLNVPDATLIAELAEQTLALTSSQSAVGKSLKDLEQQRRSLDDEQADAEKLQVEHRPQLSSEEARQTRDRALDTHLDAIAARKDHEALGISADILKTAMHTADQVVALEQTQAHRQSEQLVRDQQHDRLRINTRELMTEKHTIDTALEAIGQRVATVAGELGLSPDTKITLLQSWLGRHASATEAAQNLKRGERDLDQAQRSCELARTRVLQLLAAHVPPNELSSMQDADLPEILALAHETNTRIEGEQDLLRQQQREHRRLLEERQQRQQDHQLAQQKLSDWQQGWNKAIERAGDAWTFDNDVLTVMTALPDWRQLDEAIRQWNTAVTSLATVRESIGHFNLEFDQLISQLQSDSQEPDIDPTQSANEHTQAQRDKIESTNDSANTPHTLAALHARLSDARNNTRHAALLDEQRTQLTAELTTLESELGPIVRELTELRRQCKVSSDEDLLLCLDRIAQKNDLTRQRDEAADDRRASIPDLSDREVETRLQDLDRHQLQAEIQSLSEECASLRNQSATHQASFLAAQTSLESLTGGEQVAALVQQRATILQEMASGALDSLRARIGRIVAREGLRRFRESHRSAMLARARDAFVAITCGHFRDLKTQQDGKGNELLLGIRSDGSSKPAATMSKGTRFQLYLALRIAAYHEYATHRSPLPFVADDIMETFDDERSAAAFNELGGMARKGQVIYFTHHQHLLPIAEEVLGDALTVHRL